GCAGALARLRHLDAPFCRHLAVRAAENHRVIRVHRTRPAVALAKTRDHAVTGDLAVFHAEAMGAMSRENVELYERSFVEKHLDAVARGRLARGPTFCGSLGLRVRG